MRHVGLVRVGALVGAGVLSVAVAVGVASALPGAGRPAALTAATPTGGPAGSAAPGAAAAGSRVVVACEPTFAVPVAGVSVDLFLKIAAIRGESVDGQHRDEIDLRSVHDGVAGPGSTRCGAGAKTAGLGSLVVTKSFDLASVALLRDALTGHTEPKATIVARTRNADAYDVLGIVLRGVRIQSVREIVDAGGSAEQVSIGFARIEWTYTPTRIAGGPDPTRTVHLCWDVAADKAC